MKKSNITIVLLLSMFIHLRSQELSHSTYLVGYNLNSTEYIRQIDFSRFDYIYLMAAPDWKDVDFGHCTPPG